MRALLIAVFATFACTSNAQVLDERHQLSNELVRVMDVKSTFDVLLKYCKGEQGLYDPVRQFKENPGVFGGISPQSNYWPKVQAAYDRFREVACIPDLSDRFADKYADELAKNASVEDLHAAIEYFGSPAGRRFRALQMQFNREVERDAADVMKAGYMKGVAQFQKEMAEIMREYQSNPH